MHNETENLSEKYDQMYVGKKSISHEPVPIEVKQWPRSRNEALVHLARPGGRMLEIGCGTGSVLAALSDQYKEIVGIELSPKRADEAKKNLESYSNCQVITAPIEELPALFEQPFDCILWADVLEHIADVIGTMKQIARLSKEGTQLVTTTPNISFALYRARVMMGQGPSTASTMYPNEGFAQNPTETVLHDAGHFHYFTFRQVEILYQIAGFEPEQRLGFGSRLGKLRNWWPTMLSGTVCISGTYRGILSLEG